MPQSVTPALDERSIALRKTIIRVLEAGQRGHLGAALSLVEILRVLYDDVLTFDPANSRWPERDRFILSKGHGCIALYVLLADKGFIPESDLWEFCKDGALLGGHPEHTIPGVEASTGSLGHGLSIGVGFALSARYDDASHRVFVVVGDGESDEGSVWEAAMCAGKHRLANLTVLVDYNKHQSYASTKIVQDLEPLGDKWRSFGFGVAEVDGHDADALRSALGAVPVDPDKPTAVICHTVKGKGIPYAENNMAWHHKSRISSEEIEGLIAVLEAGRAPDVS